MPDGYVTLVGGESLEATKLRIAKLRDHQEAETGERPTGRKAAFDAGLEPLPGASFPPPRRTGWERAA